MTAPGHPNPQPPPFDPRYQPGAPGLAPPAPPAPTSAAATASLVLAILGSMCLGPVGGIAAVIVGAVALWDIHAAKGRKSGRVFAWIGLVIGGFTTAAYAAVILLLVYAGNKAASTPPPPPVYMPPPTAAPAPPGPPSLPGPGSGITMSRESKTTVTTVGTIVVVDIGLAELSLDAALRRQRALAQRHGQTLVLQTTSSGCRPCQGVAAALPDPKMQRALSGVRLARVEVGDFHEELVDLGVPDKLIPGFFLLGTDMSPRDGINGGEWDDDVAANIAPVLEAFVRGTYTKRRQPFRSPPAPKPRGTIL